MFSRILYRDSRRPRRNIASALSAPWELVLVGAITCLVRSSWSATGEFRVTTFEADITIPVGHACMGGGVAEAKEVVDPLFAKGFVFLSDAKPIVVVALDWCQSNNDSYDAWRSGLAKAANSSPERVMLATVHQHDAPICDLTAQRLLDEHGLKGWNCDPVF